MKALRFREFGLPSVLQIEDIPRPEPRDGEALVKVKAAAINPSDVKNVAGRAPGTTLPRTPGRDFSGVVIAGTKYENAEVWSSGPGLGVIRDGAQAAYIILPEEALSLKPSTLSLAQAAALGVPFLTASVRPGVSRANRAWRNDSNYRRWRRSWAGGNADCKLAEVTRARRGAQLGSYSGRCCRHQH